MFNKLNTLELSQAVGCHRTTVHRWIKSGLPRNRDKSFDLPKVIEWLITREKEAVIEEHDLAGNCDSPALERYREARAAIAELDLKVRSGKLVQADTLERSLGQRAMTFKSDLTNFAYGKSAEICDIVAGDREMVPDLIKHLLDSFEAMLGRYARTAENE